MKPQKQKYRRGIKTALIFEQLDDLYGAELAEVGT